MVAVTIARSHLGGRQGRSNRVLPVPVARGLSDTRKHTIPSLTHVENLDDGAWVPFGQQINETTPATDTPRMANGVSRLEKPRKISIEIARAIAKVLQTLVTGIEEIQVERGCVIALLDQLDLQRA